MQLGQRPRLGLAALEVQPAAHAGSLAFFSEERSFGGVKIKILLGQYKFLE